MTTSETKLGELSSWSCCSCKNCSSNTPYIWRSFAAVDFQQQQPKQQNKESKNQDYARWSELPGGRVRRANGSYRLATDPDPSQASTKEDPFCLIIQNLAINLFIDFAFHLTLFQGLGFCVLLFFWPFFL